MATFSRGVPVVRYTNKISVVEHDELEHQIAMTGAGVTTYVDKFISRAKRETIHLAYEQNKSQKLDIVDFVERVCEPVVSILFKEYEIDRNNFFNAPVSEFSLSLIVGGATRDGEVRAYFVHDDGLSEAVEEYGTIGSGAAYAELFLRQVISSPTTVTVDEAACLAVYAIKGVEIMDPYVGGDTRVRTLKMKGGKLEIEEFAEALRPTNPKEAMERVLQEMGDSLRSSVTKAGTVAAGGTST